MAYVTLADWNRYSTGLGAASPEQLEQGAVGLENTAKGLRANAAGLQAVQPAAAQGLISQAVGMENQAASLRRQAGELRAAAAASAANQKAALDLTAGIISAGANVGTAWLASDAARKQAAADRKAALAAAANQPFTNPMGNYGQPAPSSGGMSTGAMIGIGLGVVAALGTVVVLATRNKSE